MPRKLALPFENMTKVAHRAVAGVVAVAGLGIALTAGATDPAYVLSGRVTDETGIEPIAGAVVSLELGLSPDGSASKNAKLPAKLVVWQARTAADGTFSLPASTQALMLPPGTVLSDTRLKAFALAYAPYKSSDIKLNMQTTSPRQIRVLQAKAKIGIRLKLEPQDDPWISAQLDAMYNELHQGMRDDALPGGRQHAIASYGPLLSLLATSCQQIEALSNKPQDSCQKAGKEFDLRGAISKEVSFIRREPELPAPAQPKTAAPMTLRVSPPEPPAQGTVKPPPPGD
jgi:hypothetical protein